MALERTVISIANWSPAVTLPGALIVMDTGAEPMVKDAWPCFSNTALEPEMLYSRLAWSVSLHALLPVQQRGDGLLYLLARPIVPIEMRSCVSDCVGSVGSSAPAG